MVKISEMTPDERKAHYHKRQLKAATTRRKNGGDDVFAVMARLNRGKPRSKKGKRMKQI
jgi:hypothetical protein